MKHCLSIVFALLLLAGCAGSSGPVGAPPNPNTTAPPPAPAFVANFSGPNIGVALSCDGLIPLHCTLPPGATWGTLDRPGDQGDACVDPNPNPCFSTATGAYVTRPVLPGFAIISARTFSRAAPIELHCTMAGSWTDPGAWGGCVAYNGDSKDGIDGTTGEWLAAYFMPAEPGKIQIAVWTAKTVYPLLVVDMGTMHDVSITYAGLAWMVGVDGKNYPVNDSTLPTLSADPRAAIFSGPLSLTVSALSVYAAP